MMAEAATDVVLPQLKALGLEARLDSYPSDGRTAYQTWISPMGWSIKSGELWVMDGPHRAGDAFEPFRLCRYADVPMCVSTHSNGGTIEGELIDVGAGTKPEDYEGKDLRGKIVLASGYAARVVRLAVIAHHANGAVIYPSASDRPDHPDLVRYNGLWTRADELSSTRGSFQISLNQYQTLKALMQRGPVRVKGTIDARLEPGKLTLVHAYIRGREQPDREVLVTAHLDHPKWSANDNASGSAAILEMARAMSALIQAKKLPRPRSTIHFMWVSEFYGTLAYVTQHPEARRCGDWDDPRPKRKTAKGCVLANLNLDMVGEDTAKIGTHFYFTRAPDSVPSFLDALLADVLEQTRHAELRAPTGTHGDWPAWASPYFEGSDHDVFLGLGIPSTMFGHWPDWTHHSSEDTADKTDATELLRVGTLATAAAAWIALADDAAYARLAMPVRAELLRTAAERIARGPIADSAHAQARRQALLDRVGELSADMHANTRATYDAILRSKVIAEDDGIGPRRLVLIPFSDAEFEKLSGDDAAWFDRARERFGAFGGDAPTLGVVIFEAVNLANGRRTYAAIADALTDELGIDLDAAFVEALFRVLAALKLVALPS